MPAWVFYNVQNDKGDSSATPNAFLARFSGSQPTLGDVKRSFPLAGTGSFHFRFQVRVRNAKGASTTMFLDCVRDDDAVPMSGSNIVARVLRLGKTESARTHMRTRTPLP